MQNLNEKSCFMDLNSIRDICNIGSLTYYFSVYKDVLFVLGKLLFYGLGNPNLAHPTITYFKRKWHYFLIVGQPQNKPCPNDVHRMLEFR